MNKLISIGEMLIDFTSDTRGALKDARSFTKNAGGAPANVAVMVCRLGGRAYFVTKLGLDGFGDFLVEVLNNNFVDTSGIKRTAKANTPLAFVTLDKNGERDFSFYRNPSSDLLLSADEIDKNCFLPGDILHFCSVDLVDYPVKEAHKAAIGYAHKSNMLVSFDPNLRYPLWDDPKQLLKTVRDFIPLCHILKVGLDELFDITNIKQEKLAVQTLFVGKVALVLVTKGKDGVTAYFKDGESFFEPGLQVDCIDATGAGDTFIATFLFQLLKDKACPQNLTQIRNCMGQYLQKANLAAAISTTKKGAIPSMPYYDEVFLDKTK